jgi:multiple sugar transport system ATP-binding protein
MRGGVLQQLGTPRTLYDNPVNLFVAAFMGSPPISLLPGTVRAGADGPVVEAMGVALTPPSRFDLIRYVGKEVIVGIRPESVALTEAGQGDFSGVVAIREDLGASVLTTVDLAPGADAQTLVEDLDESDVPHVARRLKANVQAGRAAPPGSPVGVSLDSQRLLFFDPVTKLRLA